MKTNKWNNKKQFVRAFAKNQLCHDEQEFQAKQRCASLLFSLKQKSKSSKDDDGDTPTE